MNTTQILTASCEHLNTLSFSPAPEIAWPGVDFDPPDSGEWLEFRLFPNEPGNISWDNGAPVQMRGFGQVLVCYRPGRGEVTPSELADAVVSHFAKGTELGPVRVSRLPYRAPAVDEDGYSFIPVTIPYLGIAAHE